MACRRQAIIWTNAGILLIGRLGTNFSKILIRLNTFSFKKMLIKMSSENGGHFVTASMCKNGEVQSCSLWLMDLLLQRCDHIVL